MKLSKTRGLAFAGAVAAIYTAVSFIPGVSTLSFGVVQIRFAEALCVLCLISPWSIPGLTAGCLITNLQSPMMLLDIAVGTPATLISALLTYRLRKKPFLALLFPVIINGIAIGGLISFFTDSGYALLVNILLVSSGEAAAVYLLGYPIYKSVKKYNLL